MSLDRKRDNPITQTIPTKLRKQRFLTKEEFDILKSLNLPTGRFFVDQINQMLKDKGIQWECPYSIVKGLGKKEGVVDENAFYAVFRDIQENEPIVAGVGATAVVKYAHDATGKLYVLKNISEGYKNDFENELYFLQKLGRADRVKIINEGKTGQINYQIIMDLAEGEELFALIDEKRLPKDPILLKKIALNILRELDNIHRHGILLRDLKIENIMVNPITGDVVLVDVGFAVEYDPATGFGNDGKYCGSYDTIAPEIKSINPNYSILTDAFAAGRVLQALLLGEVVRPGLLIPDQLKTYMQIPTVLKDNKEVNYVVEKEIEKLIRSMYHEDPSKRLILRNELLSLKDACKKIEKYLPKPQHLMVKIPRSGSDILRSLEFKELISEEHAVALPKVPLKISSFLGSPIEIAIPIGSPPEITSPLGSPLNGFVSPAGSPPEMESPVGSAPVEILSPIGSPFKGFASLSGSLPEMGSPIGSSPVEIASPLESRSMEGTPRENVSRLRSFPELQIFSKKSPSNRLESKANGKFSRIRSAPLESQVSIKLPFNGVSPPGSPPEMESPLDSPVIISSQMAEFSLGRSKAVISPIGSSPIIVPSPIRSSLLDPPEIVSPVGGASPERIFKDMTPSNASSIGSPQLQRSLSSIRVLSCSFFALKQSESQSDNLAASDRDLLGMINVF
jgi:serine/threonine protein kinase